MPQKERRPKMEQNTQSAPSTTTPFIFEVIKSLNYIRMGSFFTGYLFAKANFRRCQLGVKGGGIAEHTTLLMLRKGIFPPGRLSSIVFSCCKWIGFLSTFFNVLITGCGAYSPIGRF